MLAKAKAWAGAVKRDVVALLIAGRDPRTPKLAKLVALAVALYALSPIDLIPDFIPVLGYLDDLILVPLGILLAIRLIPPGLLAEFRVAAEAGASGPLPRVGAVFIVAVWAICLAFVLWWLFLR